MHGWAGTILKAYLSEGKIVKDPLNNEFAKAFLGGRGFNSKIIFVGVSSAICILIAIFAS